MGRPPLPQSTAGAIRYYKTLTGYRARVLVRDSDGHVRPLERRAPTKAAAERALKLALRDRAPAQVHGELTADSRVTILAEAWYAALEVAALATSPRARKFTAVFARFNSEVSGHAYCNNCRGTTQECSKRS